MSVRKFLPDPNVAFACFINSCWWLPSGMFFFGLNVLDDLLLNKKLILLDLKNAVDINALLLG